MSMIWLQMANTGLEHIQSTSSPYRSWMIQKYVQVFTVSKLGISGGPYHGEFQ